MRNEQDIVELSYALSMAGKSTARAFQAIADATRKAGRAAEEFRVACYPVVPSENHPMVKQMRAIAEVEGKELVLVRYPRHIPETVIGQTYIVYDEFAALDWFRRRVVMWRGKKMVYRFEIRLSHS